MIVERNRIRAYAEAVAREFEPEKIVLFGSYAYGTPTEDSDVDLLVVMPHAGRAREQAVSIRQRLDSGFPMDLLVRSPETIATRLSWKDCFMEEVMNRGEVLYESRGG